MSEANDEDFKAVISLIDKNVDVADKNAKDIKAVISLIVRNADNINAVNSNVHAHQQDIVVLHRNNATREMELLLHRLVMMAVVAYLWWIGQAWSGHARTMYCYNDASIHIICVDEMRVEERVEK